MKRTNFIKYLLIATVVLLIVLIVVYLYSNKENKNNMQPTVVNSINDATSNINDDNKDLDDKYASMKITDMNIESNILKNLINKDWKTREVNLGTEESTFEEYSIYFDEGYEVRTIMGKTFNIIFTNKYNSNVLNGIKVGTSLEEVVKVLGKPTFGDTDRNLIGYKGNDMYVFFSKDEISVYRVEKDENKEEIVELIQKFEQEGDVWELGNSLTDIWPDYDSYNYDENYVNLTYTLKGLRLQYNYTLQNGITVFNNYTGEILEEKTVKNILEENIEVPDYIFIEPNMDLVYESEMIRNDRNEYRYNIIQEGEDEIDESTFTSKFRIVYEETDDGYNNVGFVSLTKEYANSELVKEVIINSYLWYEDNIVIYSIKNKGIYAYDLATRNSATIIKGEEEYKLESIKNNILKYDEKEITLNF